MQYNLSNEQKFIQVANDVQIPMLDLSIIQIQQQEGESSGSQQEQSQIDGESNNSLV